MNASPAARPRTRRKLPRHRLDLRVLWRDRSGRFSLFKTMVLAACLAPGLWLAGNAIARTLGARPVTELIHGTGLWTVRLLLIALAVSPARTLLRWPRLATVRRMIGVFAACYAASHFTLYIVDENFRLLTVASEIVHRFYLTIGFVTLLGLVILASTSTDRLVAVLGANWKRLHRVIYLLGVLALVHFFMQSKSDVTQAVLMAGLFAWLMLVRTLPTRLEANPFVLLLLAPAAAAATAGIEALWYALMTHLNWHRVLAANLVLDFDLGLRPSAWVGLIALAVAVVTWARKKKGEGALPPNPHQRQCLWKPFPRATCKPR
ncbi:MAG: sulfoxide reductase heme-binding subunit YedZ [Acidisphaera sp.]|nr:sulfoxide reductase heme-binding subunit YedZ [Acidisphaera sp.]